ncbi:hypothetical protein POKO110462_08695 [Pontibacter korlensis]|uniref:Uncharacterized protein n=1 Tax=Pontibacter korlensis TaxID=400092 RepID=A0A0E3UWD3_9BACT|nr:hypothetical protein [Pontibacter korlensis]AKD02581.1 hypothetical protein PKOR_04895 [Pontibacter korlensis]
MADKPLNLNQDDKNNQDIGRDLYNQDQQQNQNSSQRYSYRGRPNDRNWGEGNFFHTGPNPRGAQDRNRYDQDYRKGGASNSSYNQGQNAHLNDHYGSRAGSAYRDERQFLNHGDRNNDTYQHSMQHDMRRPHAPGDSLQNKHGDVNNYQNDQWREGPGSSSRYKEDDYRYGSGSHNWYREGRYTPDNNDDAPNRHHHRDDRGFMDRVKDTWNDIWHSDDPDYHPRGPHRSQADRISSRKHYGSEPYRDRSFDRGYEGGPRWADETDSGKDNYYDDTDRNERYRR